jgi:hypothetical protein
LAASFLRNPRHADGFWPLPYPPGDALLRALYYAVRAPFVSKLSSANLVFGRIDAGARLEIESRMPHDGVIFRDGIEEDYLPFSSGTVARIGLAEKKVHLIVGV